jgi:hypothetical protein
VLPAALAYLVGWLALQRDLVDYNSLSAAAHAWDVFHRQPQANMALIGFVQPPLPALLYLPAAVFFPGWLASGYAAPLLGSLLLGASCVVLYGLCRTLGCRPWLTVLVLALFALHPLTLSLAALGAPAMVLVFALLGLARSLVLWGRNERVRDLVAGAMYAAAAILTAYETSLLVVAAAVFILQRCRRHPGPTPARAEGTLITFLLPAVYVAGVWLIANWAIMGDPLHFWRLTLPREATPLSPHQNWLPQVLAVMLVCQPLLLALLVAALRGRQGVAVGAPAAGLLLAGLLAPLIFPTLRTTATGSAAWPALLPVAGAALGAGIVLLATIAATFSAAGTRQRQILTPGLLIIAMGSLLMAWQVQVTGQGVPAGFRSVLRGYPALAHAATTEWAVARRLGDLPGSAHHHYLAGPTAFAVALAAGLDERTEILPEPVPSAQIIVEAGSLIILEQARAAQREQWARLLPPHLGLQPIWSEGDWQALQVVPRPRVGAGGQQPSTGAIMPPEDDPTHAHSRH